jgi:hypothetical protein
MVGESTNFLAAVPEHMYMLKIDIREHRAKNGKAAVD